MNELSLKTHPDYQGLPNITFRQLEVFSFVCREGSYANAALELRSTRANIKRVCDDFEKAVGRALFLEGPNRTLQPTAFAQGLLGQITPLSRNLRRLEESVRIQHGKGRILRFAAAGEFFKGGLLTSYLARLQISDTFRPCFLRIETKRFGTALLNSECDVYFGVGIQASDRLDLVHLGQIPWEVEAGQLIRKKPPTRPAELPAGKWWIAGSDDSEATASLLDEFHAAGARDGQILGESVVGPPDDGLIFRPDTGMVRKDAANDAWPCFRFSAVLKKNHPYSELLPRLTGAAFA